MLHTDQHGLGMHGDGTGTEKDGLRCEVIKCLQRDHPLVSVPDRLHIDRQLNLDDISLGFSGIRFGSGTYRLCHICGPFKPPLSLG